jgi:hypothetical protein
MKYLLLSLPLILTGCISSLLGGSSDIPPGVAELMGDPTAAIDTGFSLLEFAAPYANILFPGSGGLLVLASSLHARRSSKKVKAAKKDHASQDTGVDVFLNGICECDTLGEAKVLARTAMRSRRR